MSKRADTSERPLHALAVHGHPGRARGERLDPRQHAHLLRDLRRRPEQIDGVAARLSERRRALDDTVTSKPYRVSQYTSTGPAILAPEMRTGVQRTSLQDIADMLGITKAAVYDHFSSRDDLVRSIVQPLIDDGEKLVLEHERRRDTPVRALLESYFDFHYRHRRDLMLVLVEMGMLARTLGWSTRC